MTQHGPGEDPVTRPERHRTDPVEDFFATARAAVPTEPADDLHWQRILQRNRRGSRLRGRLLMLGSVAAAVLVLATVLVWQRQGLTGGVREGQAIEGSGQVVRTGQPATNARSVSAAQRPTKVPQSLRTWSLSNAGQSTLYALGSRDCAGDTCPVLLRSGTNGHSWSAVHTFRGTDVSAATGSDVDQIQPVRAISQTRFATPSVGFVFGGDLWQTRDGGVSFTKLKHPGSTVLDVEINRKQAVLLSADNCAQGVCNGPVYTTLFNPATGSIGSSDASMTPQQPISAGDAQIQNGQVFVRLTDAKSPSDSRVLRLDGSKLVALRAAVCGDSGLQALTAATNIGDRLMLFALCRPVQTGDKTAYTIVRSDNAGRSWHSVAVGSLILPRLGQVWLAAADADHLVASAGGPRDTDGVPARSGGGSLLVSTDGGHAFGPVAAPKGAELPATGFDWTASAGAAYFYAVPRTTAQYWTTSRFGGPWTVVDPR